MGDQYIAAFEQGARVAQFDALALIAGTAMDRRSGWRGNQGDQIVENSGHGRGIMKRASSKA
jgi:hypothetical protein